jgi:cytidine deaminase
MALTAEIQLLIERANLAVEKVYKTNPESELNGHNVGCAVLTKSAKICTGVNISHFVGGPCAEVRSSPRLFNLQSRRKEKGGLT